MNDIILGEGQQEDMGVSPAISLKVSTHKEGAENLIGLGGEKLFVYAGNEYLAFKVGDWRNYLINNFPNFKGDLNNAAKLLSAFSDGIRATCNDKKTEITLPFALVNSEEVINGSFVSNDEYGYLVRLSQLERNSQIHSDSTISIERETGEITFIGRFCDFYELIGAEESHHYWFRSVNQKTAYLEKEPTAYSVEEYDSREIEFQALAWQIQLATARGIDDSTIKLLIKRYDNAVKFRNK